MKYSRILATGSYVPERVLTNFDLEKLVNTSDEWIQTRTGISERRLARDDEDTSDLAEKAARKAIEAAGLSPEDIDLILVATITPTMPLPSSACFLQDKLGAHRAAAFDIAAACSGFIYGLSIADSFIRIGTYRHILLVGAETLSKVVDWTDRNTCVLFGDGAGAVIIAPTEGESRIISTHLYSNGACWELLMQPGGGSRYPISHEIIEKNLHKIKMMSGNEVFKVATRAMEEAAIAALKHNGFESSDVDLLIAHQANHRIMRAVAQRLRLPDAKVFSNISKCGNTSAASIPIALDEALQIGRIKEGNLLLLAAFGAGLTWGSALIRW